MSHADHEVLSHGLRLFLFDVPADVYDRMGSLSLV